MQTSLFWTNINVPIPNFNLLSQILTHQHWKSSLLRKILTIVNTKHQLRINLNLNLSWLVSTCHDLSQLVTTCLNLSQLVSTCLDLSRLVSTCLDLSVLSRPPCLLFWYNVRLAMSVSASTKNKFPKQRMSQA
jgi:hypothetical protein